jgi:hypothetical protein
MEVCAAHPTGVDPDQKLTRTRLWGRELDRFERPPHAFEDHRAHADEAYAAAVGRVFYRVLAASLAALAIGPAGALANDTPPGFWYGTDSQYMNVRGSGPYQEPVIAGNYGGYVGMVGSWEWWLGCPGRFLAWSKVNSAQADTNFHKYHKGVGTAAYWFMGGPGVDPHYNGGAMEAQNWGARQAARTLSDIRGLPSSQRVIYPVVWMDIELPYISPAPDNGWDSVYTSPCSGVVKAHTVPASLDRAVFNGFWGYVKDHSSYRPGVYSAPGNWSRIFGTGSASSIPNTDEWTYEPETASLSKAPSGWCYRGGGGCAQFFGGVTSKSKHALMWQWSGGGGVRNGFGDFDQIDGSRAG